MDLNTRTTNYIYLNSLVHKYHSLTILFYDFNEFGLYSSQYYLSACPMYMYAYVVYCVGLLVNASISFYDTLLLPSN